MKELLHQQCCLRSRLCVFAGPHILQIGHRAHPIHAGNAMPRTPDVAPPPNTQVFSALLSEAIFQDQEFAADVRA
ncbi:hypothetical protein AWV79_14435 [Cupriavidus sp. UYMMa02A]|nr:hypothetical protein AWV79_14435 [Cupriavidus sp. UYMMa02A]